MANSRFLRTMRRKAQRSTPKPDPHIPCSYATDFLTWCEANLLAPLREKPNRTGVYKAMLELQRHYYAWYMQVPRRHREHTSTRGHICIFHVYMQILRILVRLEVNLAEPLLFMPTNAPAADLPAQMQQYMSVPVAIDLELVEQMIRAGDPRDPSAY